MILIICKEKIKKFNNFEKNYNLQYFNYLVKLKKVVYTVLLGKYDEIHPVIKQKGYDYYLITDQKIENNTDLNWTILYINEKLNYSNKRDVVKRQRYYKINPHIFFKNYDISIYFDTTCSINGNLDDFLLRILTQNMSIYVLEHPEANSINIEFKRVILRGKEKKEMINLIKYKYKRENFPDNNGLSENCLIIRKHNELRCINFMNKWFNEIKRNSHRDQLSFNYILWKNNNKDVKYVIKIKYK